MCRIDIRKSFVGFRAFIANSSKIVNPKIIFEKY